MKTPTKNQNITAQTDNTANLIKQGGKKFLTKLKQKSIRSNNSWYRILSLEKRRFIDAVIQTVNKIQSPLLIKVLTPLAEKLLTAIGGISGLVGRLRFEMQTYGKSQAQKISQLAKNWGNKTAHNWATDPGFIRYLTIAKINEQQTFRVNCNP